MSAIANGCACCRNNIIVTNGYTTRARDRQSLPLTIQQLVLTCCLSNRVWTNPRDRCLFLVRVRVEHTTTSACLRAIFTPGITETASASDLESWQPPTLFLPIALCIFFSLRWRDGQHISIEAASSLSLTVTS